MFEVNDDRSEEEVKPFKQNFVKEEAVSDFSCNDRSDGPDEVKEKVIKTTSRTSQKYNSCSDFEANDRSDTIRQP